jgi:lipooligosaccharide transport system ATP-binding protein
MPDALTPQTSAIHARGLTKRFGKFTAVDGVDFDVAPGEAFGFLGPNGAGKTSTMRMIGTVSPVTAGKLTVFGLDPAHDGPAIRSRVGVVPQADTLDNELSVLENLIIYGRYFGLSWSESRRRAVELLDFVQLTERSGDQVEPISGGMKRRLVIARALINEPEMLLLDEPTTGLDPQARHLLWDRLYRLKQRGVTLCLTTHYMDEAEQLCDRLVVMDKAKIVAEGSPRQLIERYVTREVLELRFNREDDAEDGANARDGRSSAGDLAGDLAGADAAAVAERAELERQLEGLAERIEHLPDRLLVYTADGDATAAAAFERGLHPASVLVRRASLEDVFLRLTGRSLVE